MSLRAFAESELKFLRNPEGEPDEMQDAIEKCVLDIVDVFASQGHSGTSAPYVLGILEKVLRFEPITPLTGEDDEWNEVADKVWQNRRCPFIFKNEDGPYNIQGKIFVEPDGGAYTSGDSHTPIEFPYVPKTVYIDTATGAEIVQ